MSGRGAGSQQPAGRSGRGLTAQGRGGSATQQPGKRQVNTVRGWILLVAESVLGKLARRPQENGSAAAAPTKSEQPAQAATTAQQAVKPASGRRRGKRMESVP